MMEKIRKAVLCFAHKAPKQVNILVRQLLYNTDGCTDVYIHFDKNNIDLSEEIDIGEPVSRHVRNFMLNKS